MTDYIESPIDALRALADARGWSNFNDAAHEATIKIDRETTVSLMEKYEGGWSVCVDATSVELPADPAHLAATLAAIFSRAAAKIGHGSGGA